MLYGSCFGVAVRAALLVVSPDCTGYSRSHFLKSFSSRLVVHESNRLSLKTTMNTSFSVFSIQSGAILSCSHVTRLFRGF